MEWKSPFKNDPFVMLAKAYDNLYDNPYVAVIEQHIDDKEKIHEEKYGYTSFPTDGGVPTVVIFAEHAIHIQIETFAHELAHVAVGIDQEHNSEWEKAFDNIKKEYDKIGEELFCQK